MIRREDGNDWLIITQIDHARISAELGTAWPSAAIGSGAMSDLLIAAIRDHDIGWKQWESAIEIDPKTGIPRSFTEMPIATAGEIWTRSIDHCGRNHPLPGLWVSRHFCRLAERTLTSREDEAEDVAAAKQFLTEQHDYQERLRAEALLDLTSRELKGLETLGAWLLWLLDGLSLWLCCAPRTSPLTLNLRDREVVFTPRSALEISVSPYVFCERPLAVTTTARRIPARPYASDDDLHSTLNSAPVENLAWTFNA